MWFVVLADLGCLQRKEERGLDFIVKLEVVAGFKLVLNFVFLASNLFFYEELWCFM